MNDEERKQLKLVFPETAKEWLAQWDSGKSVWSVEMGGLGPEYERVIHILVAEILRDNEEIPSKYDEEALSRWGGAAIKRCQLFPTDSQVRAAKALAFRFMTEGPLNTLISPECVDRRIQVERTPTVAPGEVVVTRKVLEKLYDLFLAGIAHEREKPRWISVKERLPIPYASVLACEDDPEMACIVCYYDDRCGGWMDTIEQNSVGKVTHWMPLPEPPSNKGA